MRSNTIPLLSANRIRTVVEIQFPGGTFSDVDGERVTDVGEIYMGLGTRPSESSITIENSLIHGGRLQDFWNIDNPAAGSPVGIYWDIGGVRFTIFKGVIDGITKQDPYAVTFDVVSIATKYNRKVGTVLGKTADFGDGYYPNCPDSSLGMIIPWVWGVIDGAVPILVDDDVITTLTASVLSSDTTIYVEDNSEFPTPSGSTHLKINDEIMKYTAFPTSTSITVDRAELGTKAGSHVVGNQVIEYGPMKFLVANHDVVSISNVRYLGRDGLEIAADPADYAITLTKPARIDFTEAPQFLEPQAQHMLKLIDMEENYVATNTTNPTYALGLHADYEPTNFATLIAGAVFDSGRVTAVVEPQGELVRMWVVVEYFCEEGDTAEVHVDLGAGFVDLGDLPNKSNTPDHISQDATIVSMGPGFEDAHRHQLPNGVHAHSLDGASVEGWRPSIDNGDQFTSIWGGFDLGYDSDPETYTPAYRPDNSKPTTLRYMYSPESLNVTKYVKMIRAHVIAGRHVPLFPSGTVDCSLRIANTSSEPGATDVDIPIIEGEGYDSFPLVPADPAEWDTDWIDVSDSLLLTVDLCHMGFVWERSGGQNWDLALYDHSVDIVTEVFEQSFGFSYEPVGSNTAGSAKWASTWDLDWYTHKNTTFNYADDIWKWTSLSETTDDIYVLYVIPAIAAEEWNLPNLTWRFNVKDDVGTFWSFDFAGREFDSTATGTYIDLTGLPGGVKASVYLQSAQLRRHFTYPASTNKRVIELGCWLLFSNFDITGATGLSGIGESNEGEYSKLGWFELASADSMQYMVGGAGVKEISVRNPTLTYGDDIKILRKFVVAEFIPYEKKIAREIVVDVEGLSGSGGDVLTDVLTEADLGGIPAASVSIPALSTSIKGILASNVELFAMVDELLVQLMARGFWTWDGVFKVKARPKVADLVGGDFMLTDGEIVGEPELKSTRLNKIRNVVEVKYKYDYAAGEFGESETDEDADSITRFGRSDLLPVKADLIRDQADAIILLNHALSYRAQAWDSIKVQSDWAGLNIEPGDVGGIVYANFLNAVKVEVERVRLSGVTEGEIIIEITGVRYA